MSDTVTSGGCGEEVGDGGRIGEREGATKGDAGFSSSSERGTCWDGERNDVDDACSVGMTPSHAAA